MACIYESLGDYLTSSDDLKEQIQLIDDIIAAMRVSLLRGAAKADIQEYQLNDGQTIIRTNYRSLNEVQTAIFSLYRQRNLLIQQPNALGRIRVARDSDSFCANKRGGRSGIVW